MEGLNDSNSNFFSVAQQEVLNNNKSKIKTVALAKIVILNIPDFNGALWNFCFALEASLSLEIESTKLL